MCINGASYPWHRMNPKRDCCIHAEFTPRENRPLSNHGTRLFQQKSPFLLSVARQTLTNTQTAWPTWALIEPVMPKNLTAAMWYIPKRFLHNLHVQPTTAPSQPVLNFGLLQIHVDKFTQSPQLKKKKRSRIRTSWPCSHSSLQCGIKQHQPSVASSLLWIAESHRAGRSHVVSLFSYKHLRTVMQMHSVRIWIYVSRNFQHSFRYCPTRTE